jgi:hypothetical protein
MKVQLINSYKKLSTVTDSNGLPVVENGAAKKVLRTMFRYGVVGATPEEITLYKRFKNQEGTNYYREENGVPLFHSREFIGNEAKLNHYVREDGKIGFSVNSTEVDALQAMAEKFPHLAQTLALQISAIMLSGSTLDMGEIAINDPIEQEEL